MQAQKKGNAAASAMPAKASATPAQTKRGSLQRLPKVSIVVTVYNKESYISDSISSITGQYYKNIEIIVVNDGSTDNSMGILNEVFAQNDDVAIISQHNRGLSAARNIGFRVASGKYVLFHDADDLLEADAIQRLVAVAELYGSDIVGGVFRRKLDDREYVVKHFQEDVFNVDFKTDIDLAIKYSTNFSACNKLFRRRFLNANNLVFRKNLQMEDIDFWLRAMFLSDKVSQTKNIISSYRYVENSLSMQKTKKRFDSLFQLTDELSKFYDDRGWSKFDCARDIALLQGAINFFVKWKLEEFGSHGDATELLRLRTLLKRMTAEHIARFYIDKNQGPTAAICLLVREGRFDVAKAVLEQNDVGGHRELMKCNPRPTATDIVDNAIKLLETGKNGK